MHRCIWLIAFVSSTAFAHGNPHVRDGASTSQTGDRPALGASIKKANPGQENTSEAKSTDERQRFCVRNHLGRVNCVVFPGAEH
jgi:hypothetical protein